MEISCKSHYNLLQLKNSDFKVVEASEAERLIR